MIASVGGHPALALILATQRLLLRPPKLADVAALFEFLGDSKAMAHTHVDATPRDCRRRIAGHEWQRRRNGYAPWTVLRRDDQRIIGWGGLYIDPFDPDWGTEIGYFLHPDTWGQGFASELASACTALADGALGLPELRAFAHPANAGSRKVLEKAGFTERRYIPKMDRLLYARRAPTSTSRRHT